MSKKNKIVDKLVGIHYDIKKFRQAGDWIGLNEYLKPYKNGENKDVNELKTVLIATKETNQGAIISSRLMIETIFNREMAKL